MVGPMYRDWFEIPPQKAPFQRIQLSVGAVHLLVLAISVFFTATSTELRPSKLLVQTITLPTHKAEIPQIIAQAPASETQKLKPPVPKPQEPPPVTTEIPQAQVSMEEPLSPSSPPPTPAVKKKAPKAKPSAPCMRKTTPTKLASTPKPPSKPLSNGKEVLSQKQQALLTQALSSLDQASKIAQKKESLNRQSPSNSIQKTAIVTLASESLLSITATDSAKNGNDNYYSELILRLQSTLHLPEDGSVKVTLTLQRSGKVLKAQITACKSKENAAYLENTLSCLSFAPFGTNFPGKDLYTFHLCLANQANY
jgi:colicin import membrane protein